MDAKKLKLIVRGDKKSTFGTDPNEPWSVRAGITESERGELHAYLKSRGINPDFVSKDTKISHAKSSEFHKWRRDHQFDDPINFVSTTVADKMKQQRAQTEEVEQMNELAPETLASYVLKTTSKDPKRAEPRKKAMSKLAKIMAKRSFSEEKKPTALEKFRAAAAEREKKHDEIQKKQSKDGSGMTAAIDRLAKHLNKEETINEVSSSEVQHHFDKWTNSEHAPYNSDAGDDNKVHQSALRYLRSTNVPKENHEKLAMHIAHKFHGSGIDEEVKQIEERNKQNAMKRQASDAARGHNIRLKSVLSGKEITPPKPEHKSTQDYSKAIGRESRKMEESSAYGRISSRFKALSGRSLDAAAKEHGDEAKRLQKEIEAQQKEIDRRKAAMKNEEVEQIDENAMHGTVYLHKYHEGSSEDSYGEVGKNHTQHAYKVYHKKPGEKPTLIGDTENNVHNKTKKTAHAVARNDEMEYDHKSHNDAVRHVMDAAGVHSATPIRYIKDKKQMNEEVEQIDEKNVPTSPEKWARAKAAAKSKFAVYPSAYANGWASKKYKAMGGGWKSVNEEVDITEKNDSHTHAAHYEDPKTGEWTGMNLLIAKDDDDAIRQANEKCKEGCRLTKVERHITVKEEVEQIDELKKSTVFSWLKQQPVVPEKKPGMSRKDHNKKIKTSSKSWNRALDRLAGYKPTSESAAGINKAKETQFHKKLDTLVHNTFGKRKDELKMKEDVFQDTQAATQTAFDMGTQADDREPTYSKRKEMSKSARMIKSLYKKHKMVKEDMYDHEKEDKSVATYGKKPKVDKQEVYSDDDTQAAMVLKGGTTLTGQTRDTLEIDPVMRKTNKSDNKENR